MTTDSELALGAMAVSLFSLLIGWLRLADKELIRTELRSIAKVVDDIHEDVQNVNNRVEAQIVRINNLETDAWRKGDHLAFELRLMEGFKNMRSELRETALSIEQKLDQFIAILGKKQ